MLYLHGIGHFHPEIIIDNTFLESLDIGTDRSWIEERTGILARHTVLPLDYIRTTRNRDPRQATEAALYSHAEMAHRAARIALDRAGLDATAIGLVISGGSSPWMGSPAEACLVAERLGIQAAAFDVNSACSTFAVQMRTLLAMQPTALPDFILVVNPESLTCAVSYDDRGTAVLMGDCGSAAVVSPRIPACRRIDRACYESDPANWRKVDIPAAGYLTQDGSAVQAFAIRKTVAAIERLRPLAKSPRFRRSPGQPAHAAFSGRACRYRRRGPLVQRRSMRKLRRRRRSERTFRALGRDGTRTRCSAGRCRRWPHLGRFTDRDFV